MDGPWGHYAKGNKWDYIVLDITECPILYNTFLSLTLCRILKKKSWTHRNRDWMVGNWEMLVKENKLLLIKWVSSGDVMYSMVTRGNNTVLYTRQ